MTRAKSQPQASVEKMRQGLRAGCTAHFSNFARNMFLAGFRDLADLCKSVDDNDVAGDYETVSKGYIPLNLNGIWARAPYLHNGSVPTLFDLLQNEKDRPTEFWRGIPYYNPAKVGFVSTTDELVELYRSEVSETTAFTQDEIVDYWLTKYPTAALYQVDQTTRSNKGHYNIALESETSDKIKEVENWSKMEDDDVNALLEYLKTL